MAKSRPATKKPTGSGKTVQLPATIRHPDRSVVTVGEGRGFIVEGTSDRFIITAAHCLPRLPPCDSCSFYEERTYQFLVGPLGRDKTVWAECLFADPVGDIAVLGAVESQALTDKYEGYQQMFKELYPFPVSEAPSEGTVRLLSLDARWFECRVERMNHGPLRLFDASENIVGGMSGSPIIASDGSAIGVLCTARSSDEAVTFREGGPNPAILTNLPGWLLHDLAAGPYFSTP